MDVLAEWDAMLDQYGAVEFPVSRTLALKMLAGMIVFDALGVALIVGSSIVGVAVGVLCVLFFGVLGIPVVLGRVITGRPRLGIDHHGVTYGRQQVAWAEITSVRREKGVRGESRNLVLGLTPEADARVKRELNPVHRAVESRIRRTSGGPSMTIINLCGFDAGMLVDWLCDLRRRAKASGNADAD